MAKYISIHDLFAKGSKSFREANAGTAGKVSGGNTVRHEQADRQYLDVPPPDPLTQQINPGNKMGRSCPTCGGPEGPLRLPRVTFTLFRVRLLDIESKSASVKYLLDGLRYADLIPDDREKDIQLFVNQTRVDSYIKEGTAIKIEYP